MAAETEKNSWTSEDLLKRLERGENFFVLDVRNRDEFERFRLEGRKPLPSVNVPYFEIIELGGKDDMVESVVAYFKDRAESLPPSGLAALSVCAKGETSEYVAEGLRQLGRGVATLQGGMKSWGLHYATRAVVETADLAVYQVSRPARGCLSYVVASDGKALVIDPLRHLHPYLGLARSKGLVIEGVVDTHGHADHITGGPALASRLGVPYFLHPYDAIHPVDLLPATIPYEPVRAGQVFSVGRHRIEALHTPGHTLGHVALRLDDRCLFAGDSIFIRSISRPDLGGKAESWAPVHGRSLRALVRLPGAITVLPGHFSSLDEENAGGLFAASLDELKRRNEGLLALQRETEDGFIRYLLASLPPFIADYVDIKRVNVGLKRPSEDDAAALELGKNACALSQARQASGGGTP